MERNYKPRAIDRAVFAILAFLHVANGVYLIGPWYLDETESGKAPLISMFNSDNAVSVYGVLLVLDGLLLIYASAGRGARKNYTRLVNSALLYGFVLRLYALIGVLLTIESWRPPSYLSHTASVFILGSYWVWVKVSARPTQ